MSLKPWIQSPVDFGEWGTRFNAWMKDLVTDQTRQDGLITAVMAQLATVDVVSLTLSGGWAAFDASHAQPRAFRHPDGMVHLEGLVKWTGATLGAGTYNPATLPVGWRLANAQHNLFNTRVYTPSTGDTSGRIDVRDTGALDATFPGALVAGSYVSLSGICFQGTPA